MRFLQNLRLFLAIILVSSCSDTSERIVFQEVDKDSLVFPLNILSKEYINSVEFKNERYQKSYDSVLFMTTLEHESEIWNNQNYNGGFVSSTYIYPDSDLDLMSLYFASYMAGHSWTEKTSSIMSYVKNDALKLPFEEYYVFDIYVENEIKVGIAISILKDTKIIHITLISKEKFKIEKEKLIYKIQNI